MNNLQSKLHNRWQRKRRIRSVIKGSLARPRLTVTISNLHVTAQLIDDVSHRTIAFSSTIGQKTSGTMTDKAILIGKSIGDKAKTAKIKQIVFDRNGKLYHGRIKALADAARKTGLEF